jgi:predicted dehydrogenase
MILPLLSAIIGTGFVGAIHARSARLAGGVIAGVAASTPERSRRAADALGAERAYDGAEELATADGVDVVHICTPNHLHAPLARAALDAGKHVICEKPLAMTAEEAATLEDPADRITAVPFVFRYYATVREARVRARNGSIGPIRLIHGNYLQDWLLEPSDDNWRVDSQLGGASRAFADIGSHWCDMAEFVSGHRITRLNAQTLIAMPERVQGGGAAFTRNDADGPKKQVTTEDAAIVQFETDGGAIGTTVLSQISAGRKNQIWLELAGSGESLAFNQEEPETLWRGRREHAILVKRDAQAMHPEAAKYAVLPAGHPQGYADCFDAFVGEVYDAIRGGEPADGLPRFADGLRAARITDAVLTSASERRWVELSGS